MSAFSELVAALEDVSTRAGLAMSRTAFLDIVWDEETSIDEVLALEPLAMIDRGPRRLVIGCIRDELRYFLTLDADPRALEHIYEMGVLHVGARRSCCAPAWRSKSCSRG